MAKATNTDAIETASGQDWQSWVAYLKRKNGETLSHAALAAAAKERLHELNVESPDWWAQGIAVAFEQAIGRRKPGQRADGTHELSVSKTFGRDLDHTLEVWSAIAAEAAPYRGVTTATEPQTSSTEKWRYWRATLEDGTKVQATIGLRENGKSFAAFTHAGFDDDGEIDEWKAYWRYLLAAAAARAKADGQANGESERASS